jgi:hypothetical protein
VVTDDVRFREAYRRAWVGNSTGTVRYTFAAFGCLFLVGIQVAMFVVEGQHLGADRDPGAAACRLLPPGLGPTTMTKGGRPLGNPGAATGV